MVKKCPDCGFDNKDNAVFCKQCGKKLEKSLMGRLNDEINFLAVFIGLAVSCIVLIIGSFIFATVIASPGSDLTLYIGLVLILMVLLGGMTTGIIECREYKEGVINGLMLSLIALVILGFIIGVILFIVMGIAGAIASAFKPYASLIGQSTSSYTTNNSSSNLDLIETVAKGFVMTVLVFISGAIGGSLGVFLKKLI